MLSDDLAARLVRLRRAAGLTRDQLAEQCAGVDWPELTTSALGNIETGRRDANGLRRRQVTVDELVVLAYVLDVPPLELLLPLDEDRPADLFAGGSPRTADLVAWFRGDRRLAGGNEPRIYQEFRLYVKAGDLGRELVTLLGEWGAPTESASSSAGETSQERPPGWTERYRQTLAELREVRGQLRSFDRRPPALPRAIEWADTASTDDPPPKEGR